MYCQLPLPPPPYSPYSPLFQDVTVGKNTRKFIDLKYAHRRRAVLKLAPTTVFVEFSSPKSTNTQSPPYAGAHAAE